jgi:hypothetical protein
MKQFLLGALKAARMNSFGYEYRLIVYTLVEGSSKETLAHAEGRNSTPLLLDSRGEKRP